ncbi:hypothetical protein PR048_015996 [Dryococelus australis]|uniref:Uncharacterized protein n=1 Tax=Dryococelus australis TaxID=614101 RepID=A0ABQ9HIV2_9NEOP|nr:hypothetical protein PR048_015996 [Dryococelus australis]
MQFDRLTMQASVEPTPGPSGFYEPREMEKISRVPDASKCRLQCRKRKPQRSAILTSTPLKKMLQAKHDDKVENEPIKCLKYKKPQI